MREREKQHDPVDTLLQSIGNALQKFVQRQQTLEPEGVARLDFVTDQLLRPGRPPFQLRNTLTMRLLEEFFRRAVISCEHYLLLMRVKPSGRAAGTADPGAALRHDIDEAADLVELADVPIRIIREREGHYRMSFDPNRVTSNVTEAAKLTGMAHDCLRSSEFAGAAQGAVHALGIDPDALHAALVVVETVRRGQHDLERDEVLRAELCIARAVVRNTASALRLSSTAARGTGEGIKARRRARRYLGWLYRKWPLLRSVPFGSSPSECPGADPYRDVLAAVVEMAVAAEAELTGPTLSRRKTEKQAGAKVPNRAGAAYERFVNEPAVIHLAEKLVHRHWPAADGQRCHEAASVVSRQLPALLLVNGWLPVGASMHEFEEQFVRRFERRVDWSAVSRRSRGSGLTFRDEFYLGDDDEHRGKDDEDRGAEDDD